MKKCAVVFLTAAIIILTLFMTVCASTEQQNREADGLHSLGLFLGYGDSYGLDDNLTRYQGYVLMIRMLGEEDKATSGTYSHPFTDVNEEWAEKYVAYAYSKELTKGMGNGTFAGNENMNLQQFTTICLRTLGYKDSGDSADFSYAGVLDFAKSKGLIINETSDARFTRGDVVSVFWRTLTNKMNGSDKTLADYLTEKNVFSKESYTKALNIKNSTATTQTGQTGNTTDGTAGSDGGNTSGSTSTNTGGSTGGTAATRTCRHKNTTSEIISEPTCSKEGKIQYTCTNCGEAWVEKIDKSEHTPSKAEEIAPTCTTAGRTEGTVCSVCKEIIEPQEKIEPLGHHEVPCDYEEPTCISYGYMGGSYCDRCGEEITPRERMDMLEHEYGEDNLCIYCGQEDPRQNYETERMPV